jgi:hypothetical protein
MSIALACLGGTALAVGICAGVSSLALRVIPRKVR